MPKLTTRWILALFQTFICHVLNSVLVNQSFLRDKHLPLFKARNVAKVGLRGILISNYKKSLASTTPYHIVNLLTLYTTFLFRAISQRIITGTGTRCQPIGKRESIARNRHYPLKGKITVNRCYISECVKLRILEVNGHNKGKNVRFSKTLCDRANFCLNRYLQNKYCSWQIRGVTNTSAVQGSFSKLRWIAL